MKTTTKHTIINALSIGMYTKFNSTAKLVIASMLFSLNLFQINTTIFYFVADFVAFIILRCKQIVYWS